MSANSTNHRLETFGKKFQKVPKSKTRTWCMLATIYIAFTLYLKLFTYTYILLGIISNLEMIESIWEDVHRLYANTTPFYIRNLSICRFWYPWGVMEPILGDDCILFYCLWPLLSIRWSQLLFVCFLLPCNVSFPTPLSCFWDFFSLSLFFRSLWYI